MTDLVKRLRKHDCQTMLDTYDVMDDAADEIERLRQAIKQAKREALLDAAEWFNEGDPAWCRLKEMAEEIK